MDRRLIQSKGQLEYGFECDVYSLGVVVEEIVAENQLDEQQAKTKKILAVARSFCLDAVEQRGVLKDLMDLLDE